MTGNETVKYLKSKYQEGKDYAHIAAIVKKSRIEVWHAVPAMVAELKSLGFVEEGFCCSKSWQQAPAQPQVKVLASGWTVKKSQINWDAGTFGDDGRFGA